jgi:hypothetical protein
MRNGITHLIRKATELLIFLCEKAIQLLPEHFPLGPPKQALGTKAPAIYNAGNIRADDRGVGRAINYLPEMRRGKRRAECWL